MAAAVKCPKGHWFDPDASGRATLCPHCKAQSALRSGNTVSEDDILSFLGAPREVVLSDFPSEEEPVIHEEAHLHSLKRRKKVCHDCFFETSVSFGHCPRCGGQLEIASTEEF
jgi:hypothetical protein